MHRILPRCGFLSTQIAEAALWRMRLYLRLLVKRFNLPQYTEFVISAVLVGAIAGLAAVLFHNAIEFFRTLFFSRTQQVIGFLGSLRIILLPALGMLLQSAMISLWPELAKQKGVIEVIKAVALRGGYIPLRVTLFQMIAPAICMGSGGTVGPEGPAAQIGAGVASRMGHALRLADHARRIFTAAGSGAAIAALFNTPLGGVFFAIEIALLNDLQAGTFSALLLASVTASTISRVLVGNDVAFVVEQIAIGSYRHIFLYGLLGLCAGVLSVAYLRYAESLHRPLQKMLKRFPRWAVMSCVGLLVGLCGFFFYDIIGIGYAGVNNVLRGYTVWYLAAILLALKFLLVPLTLEAGGFGGTFAPSLFLGAMLGFLFAACVNVLAPVTGVAAHAGTFTLVGMGAVLAALNSVPLAAIMIIFEMTNDYSFILPLMLGVVCSTLVTHATFRESLHSRKLRKAGYMLKAGHEVSLLQRLQVRDVMRRGDIVRIKESSPYHEVIKTCIESTHEAFYTIDANGKINGTIALSDLRKAFAEYEDFKESPLLLARDIAAPRVTVVSENDHLDDVIGLFCDETPDEFPVISAREPDKILGSIRKQDIVRAYNEESLKQNLTKGVARGLRTLEKFRRVAVAEGYSVIELEVPDAFVGKTLAALKLRNRFKVEVVLILPAAHAFAHETSRQPIMPGAGYTLRKGEVMILFGNNRMLDVMEKIAGE